MRPAIFLAFFRIEKKAGIPQSHHRLFIDGICVIDVLLTSEVFYSKIIIFHFFVVVVVTWHKSHFSPFFLLTNMMGWFRYNFAIVQSSAEWTHIFCCCCYLPLVYFVNMHSQLKWDFIWFRMYFWLKKGIDDARSHLVLSFVQIWFLGFNEIKSCVWIA